MGTRRMAVRSRKYSRKYILCAEIFVQCAEKLYSARKSCNPSYIYYLCPKTFIQVRKHFSLRGNIKSSRGNIFTLRGNLLTMRGNLFTVRGNLCAARKYFQVPVNFFVCARKLLCSMRRFWASNHFRNAVEP